MRLILAAIAFTAGVALSAITYTDNVQSLGSSGGINYFEVSDAAPAPPVFNTLSTAFDGINDYVTPGVPSVVKSLTNNMSAFVWAKIAVGNFGFYGRWGNTSDRSWLFTHTGSKLRINLSLDGGTTTRKRYDTSIDVYDDTWHHVGFTFADNALIVYVDGAEDTNVVKGIDGVLPFINTSDEPFYIGCAASGPNPANFENGLIDEPTLWDKVLSAAEVSELYNSGSPADATAHSAAANLVFYLRMGDGDTHPTIVDHSASATNATMFTMSQTNFVTEIPAP